MESVPDIFQVLFSPPATPKIESAGKITQTKEPPAPATHVTPIQKRKPRKPRAVSSGDETICSHLVFILFFSQKSWTPKPLSELIQPYVEMEMMARPFILDERDNFASAFAPWERSAYVTLF